MTISEEVVDLARVLADWVSEAPGPKLYFFGSRVRGDHRPDSDVDVSIEWVIPSDADDLWWEKNDAWWAENNRTHFASINSRLPGPLRILEDNDSITERIRAAPVVYQDRRVVCVWSDPKTQ